MLRWALENVGARSWQSLDLARLCAADEVTVTGADGVAVVTERTSSLAGDMLQVAARGETLTWNRPSGRDAWIDLGSRRAAF